MNFLAHLHIAHVCHSDMLGNLLGDFVKGSPNERYPAPLWQGIGLHRFVDSYTDSHPLMEQCKPLFKNGTRRYALIALDMCWDHCLACKWRDYYPDSIAAFSQYARQRVEQSWVDDLPAGYLRLHDHMWDGGWLASYADFANIEYALQNMARRSPRMAPLAQTSQYMRQNLAFLNGIFDELYPDVLQACRGYCQHANLLTSQ